MLKAGLALGLRPVQLNQKRRVGVQPVARVRGLLGGLNGQPVHHLDRRRDDPRSHNRADRLTGLADVGEEGDQCANGLRAGHHSEGDAGGHAQRSLGTHERAQQVIAGGVPV